MRVHNIPMNHASRSLLDDKSTSTTPPPSNSSSSSTTTTTDATAVHFDSSSLAVTALVLLSALFFLAFFSIYARRFFASSTSDYDADHLPARRRRGRASLALRVGYGHSSAACGLDSTTIRSLPLLSYTSGLKAPADSPGGGCVVCLSEFEEGETVKLIPGCGHLFHPQCIDAWLGDHGSCPLCRSTDVFAPSSKVDDRPYVMERAETRHELQVVVVDGGRTTAAVEEGEGRRKLGGLGRSRSWDCMEVERSAAPRRSCSL